MDSKKFFRFVVHTVDGKSFALTRFSDTMDGAIKRLQQFVANIYNSGEEKFFVELSDKSAACVILANVATIRIQQD